MYGGGGDREGKGLESLGREGLEHHSPWLQKEVLRA